MVPVAYAPAVRWIVQGLLGLALALTNCGSNKDFQCQVLCKYPSGQVLGSDTTIKVQGSSADDATQNCPQRAPAIACAGDAGATVFGCSCY
jgi:hypothetical protein